MSPARTGQGRAGPRGREEIREPVHFRESVFVRSWPLRQLCAGLRPGSDRGLCPETQDGCTDKEAYYTISLLTEFEESVLGQGFYTHFLVWSVLLDCN